MDGPYEVVFYGGPMDGLQGWFDLPMFGLPGSAEVLTYDTRHWRHHYLVRAGDGFFGESLSAKHVRIARLPMDSSAALDAGMR